MRENSFLERRLFRAGAIRLFEPLLSRIDRRNIKYIICRPHSWLLTPRTALLEAASCKMQQKVIDSDSVSEFFSQERECIAREEKLGVNIHAASWYICTILFSLLSSRLHKFPFRLSAGMNCAAPQFEFIATCLMTLWNTFRMEISATLFSISEMYSTGTRRSAILYFRWKIAFTR